MKKRNDDRTADRRQPPTIAEIDLLDTIRLIQSQFTSDEPPLMFYDKMLSHLIKTSQSSYGFIGDILYTDAGDPYFKMRAVTNIAWNQKSLEYFVEHSPNGLDFFNLKNLFGAVLTTGKYVLTNDTANDVRSGGLPLGHPLIESFLGMPLFHDGKLIGMVGMANRRGGYDESLAKNLEPLFTTFSTIIAAYWNARKYKESEKKYRGLLECAPDALVICNQDGKIILTNTQATSIFGYSQEELIGEPVEVLIPEDIRAIHKKKHVGYFSNPKVCPMGKSADLYGLRKDGSQFPIEVSLGPLRTDSGVLVTASIRDVTERKRAEEEIILFRTALDCSADAVFLIDRNKMRFIDMNATACASVGYSREELLTMGPGDIKTNITCDELALRFDKVISSQQEKKGVIETVHRRKDGSDFPVEILFQALDSSTDKPILIATARDITDRKRAERLKDGQNEIIHQIYSGNSLLSVLTLLCQIVEEQVSEIRCSVMLIEEDTGRLQVCAAPNLSEKLQRALNNLEVKPCAGTNFTSTDVRETVVMNDLTSDPLWGDFHNLALADGLRAYWSQPIIESEGKVLGAFCMLCEEPRGPLTDEATLLESSAQMAGVAIERKQLEQKLRHDALHDPLTDLPNRALFVKQLELAIQRYKRNNDYSIAVLFLDLDRFKTINDSLGHLTGDNLLVQTAQRLQKAIRETDIVARLGGDEFAVLAENFTDVNDVILIAERIHEALQQPFNLEGEEVFTSTSIGIAVSTAEHHSADDILRDADTAMYRAKSQGNSRFELFTSEMTTNSKITLTLENQLRQALNRQEFRVFYQPIISLTTMTIVGFEALLRWEHPERGIIPPSEFLDVAEKCGLMIPVGWWVMQTACGQLREWQNQFPTATALTLNVNFSPRQIIQPNVIEKTLRIIDETGIKADNLYLEITEHAAIENTALTLAVLTKLHEQGVRLVIDDFGTGYSSLSHLQLFPFSSLKVDRSFISGTDQHKRNSHIVHTTIDLAHNLGMTVVAEGVETKDQMARLIALGCDFMQGYFIAKPLPPDDVHTLLLNESQIDQHELMATATLSNL
ncbi:Phytochrome-like protein cph2 [Gimesia alba]|uniref:Phytochrome-like protein cph2 n=2 Tax=Gimesia alba TaxID=2527973 RepID=A0A517RMV5_9PLAN|nr:Phytochrome-like protein cph2 [Gimesia alba]